MDRRQRALAEAIEQMLGGARRLLDMERADRRRKKRGERKAQKKSECDEGRGDE